MEKEKASKDEWEKFTDANNLMRKMYDDWVNATCAAVGDIKGLTVTEIGCNTGYFLYRFLEKGAAKCIGYDRYDYSPAIDLLNDITGNKVHFKQKPYNLLTRKLPGINKYDIVISSAVICHLSEPLDYIKFLASITKKALLIHTRISDEDNFIVSYGKANKYHPNDPFPICFDNDITISKPLFLESLRLTGFKHPKEITYSDKWLPLDWYHWQKTYIALRDEIPIFVKPNFDFRWAWVKRLIRRTVGYKRYESVIKFIKSKPRLLRFTNRHGL